MAFANLLKGISIHAAREGGDSARHRNALAVRISIHAAREGGDRKARFKEKKQDISIHAAREGGDLSAVLMQSDISQFQSTPPVKAATNSDYNVKFNFDISIHAAREGGDPVR